jgi:hypothetical protein
MELIIRPDDSFNKNEKKSIIKIILFVEKILEKNNIQIPKIIYFYNSLEEFIEKILPEVEEYGFDKKTSKEIIKCALNNGTYGTINFNENSIIEMNFNPFNKGTYYTNEFLELIIHESLHLHLSKMFKKDINSFKFRFNKEKFIGDKKIIQFDEGYTEFMTWKILKNVNINDFQKIKIPKFLDKKPSYKKEIKNLDIDLFDRNFENLLISNRNIGFEIFKKKFNEKSDNQLILDFAMRELKNII